MNTAAASIRELRTDFRRVKRRLEALGQIVITDRGEPACVLKRLPAKLRQPRGAPDCYARLLKHQPRPISAAAVRRFWEEERGGR